METKHTPGPWYVGAQNDLLFILDGPPSPAPYDGPIPKTYGPSVIAKPDYRIDGYEANARLIAAAPDLLAALTTFVAEYVQLVESGDAGNWDAETEAKVIAARAAIAKATTP